MSRSKVEIRWSVSFFLFFFLLTHTSVRSHPRAMLMSSTTQSKTAEITSIKHTCLGWSWNRLISSPPPTTPNAMPKIVGIPFLNKKKKNSWTIRSIRNKDENSDFSFDLTFCVKWVLNLIDKGVGRTETGGIFLSQSVGENVDVWRLLA